MNKIDQDLLEYTHTIPENNTIYVFRNRFAFLVQLNHTDIRQLDFVDEFNELKIQEIMQNNSYVIIQDFPQINKKSSLWKTLKTKCELMETFKSNQKLFGYVYCC
jgi:ATP-dependent RNA circularization protein (DNA/RNA ligase family)